MGKKYSMKPLDVLNILLLLIVGNCYCIYLQKNRHLKGTNEKKKKNRDGKHTEQSLKVQGTRYEVKEEEKNFKKPLMFFKK